MAGQLLLWKMIRSNRLILSIKADRKSILRKLWVELWYCLQFSAVSWLLKSLCKAWPQNAVIGDGIWVHHNEPEDKRWSMESHRLDSVRKNFTTTHSAGKAFCQKEEVVQLEFIPNDITINSHSEQVFFNTRPHLKWCAFAIWQCKTWNNSLKTRKVTTAGQILHYPELAPADFHLLVKEAIQWTDVL